MKRVCLGKIVKPHGIKGLVKIRPYGDDPLLIETLGPVFTAPSGDQTLSITMKNSDGKFFLAAIDGYPDRTAVESLNGTELYVARDKLPDIDEGFYHEDLVGLHVFENGQNIGKTIAFDDFGAGELFEIQPHDGNSFYLPYRDEFVLRISLDEGLIEVKGSQDMRME